MYTLRGDMLDWLARGAGVYGVGATEHHRLGQEFTRAHGMRVRV